MLYAGANVVIAALVGCAQHTQTQFFRVRDPNTGAANYYRLTVHGGSSGKYNFQAGYYSAASVDILRGSMPSLPTLDLPVERVASYDRLLNYIDSNLWQAAREIAPITDPGLLADSEVERVHQARTNLVKLAGDLAQTQRQLTTVSRSIADSQKRLSDLQGAASTTCGTVTNLQRTVEWARTNTSPIAMMSAALVQTITNTVMQAEVQAQAVSSNLSNAATPELFKSCVASNAVLAANLADLLGSVSNAVCTLEAAPTYGATNLLNLTQLASISNQLTQASDLCGMAFTSLASTSNTLASLAVGLGTNGVSNAKATNQIALAQGQLSRASRNLYLTTGSLSDAMRYVEGIHIQDTNAVVALLEGDLSNQQAHCELGTSGVAEQMQVLANLQTEQLGLRQTLLSIEAERDFQLERQTNAAQAAFQLEQMATQAKLARANFAGSRTNSPVPPFSDFDSHENRFMELARLLWMNSLSGADITSVGMARDTKPQNFRKLVFWAKSQTESMDQVFGSLDDVVGQVVAIGDTYKKIGQQRAGATATADALQQARKASAIQALNAIVSANPTNCIGSITNVVEMLVPSPVTNTNPAQVTQ